MGFLHRLFGHKKEANRPKVMVDFTLQNEGLYLTLINASAIPAYEVCTFFDHPIMGYNGTKNLAELPVFKNTPYLAPYKSITLFIDPIDLFFYHAQHNTICIETHYKDDGNCTFKEKNRHDLTIYKHLPINSQINFLIEEN